MGSLQSKLNWLIDRKIELINFIKSKTTSYNTTGSLISSGTQYSNISMNTINSELNAFFPSGFVEVVYTGMYSDTGTLTYDYYPNYNARGSIVSVSRTGEGQYTVYFTRPSDLTSVYIYFYLYAIGGHRDDSFNSNIDATASPLSAPSSNPLSWKLITGDRSIYYDGYFTIIIFALYRS